MKKTYGIKFLRLLSIKQADVWQYVMAILLTLAILESARGQNCAMFCPLDPIQYSLGADCVDTISAADLDVFPGQGCLGPFTVDILYNGESIGNIIDDTYLGLELMVIITDEPSQNTCMASILILDKQPPLITCLPDTVISCFTDLNSLPQLDTNDIIDCSPVSVFVLDELVFSGECHGDTISKYNRLHIIVDSEGNADTCFQMIWMRKVSIDSTIFPPDLKGANALSCIPPPDTTPDITGYPTIEGFPIINGLVCNLSATYIDQVVDLCSGSYKILRTWTVTDWCDGNLQIDSLQVIEVRDETGPVVEIPGSILAEAGEDCEADVNLPQAEITEDCSDPLQVTVRMETPMGNIPGNGGLLQGVPVGVYNIIYIATNDCGLEGRDTLQLTVVDETPPTPVCKQEVVVPLNQEGMAVLFASSLNAGSTDNCNPVFFKVKRMEVPAGYACTLPTNPGYLFDDKIKLCCEDIAHNPIMVILRVYDLEPDTGPVGDEHLSGNFSECMVQVSIQDKIAPSIICPPDLTISCEFPLDPDNLGIFGEVATHPAEQSDICFDDPGNPENASPDCYGTDGLATDNCSVTVSEEPAFFVDSLCGTGYIIRTFVATDDGGLSATCTQTITIVDFEPFTVADILWPEDYTTSEVCEAGLLHPDLLPAPYDYPALGGGSCQMVTSSFSDSFFDFSDSSEACFKILRKWQVIDWCQYNPETGQGLWTNFQVLKANNSIPPELNNIQDITVCTDDEACGPGNLVLTASATDDCTDSESLEWQIFIDLDNDNSIDISSPLLSGGSINFPVILSLGTHRVLYKVEDLCGNTETQTQFVEMVSCKPPSAKCMDIIASLMPVDTDGDSEADWGMIEIRAHQLDAGSDHLCGNPVSVAFSNDPTDTTLVFDCEDIGGNSVELWVIDDNGNTDFCIATVIIQDNAEVCPPPDPIGEGDVSGKIFTDADREIEGVNVEMAGTTMQPSLSDEGGYYAFRSMPFGGTYEVMPVLTEHVRNGVSTLDLLRIQKHLLGIERFSSPYQYIAADVNKSNSVSAVDIIELRKLLLGITDQLSNNSSWRFVDAGYAFTDPEDPLKEDFPESYLISPFSNDMEDVNFIGIKIGDLNHSAITHLSANENNLETRSAGIAHMSIDNRWLTAGQIVEVPLFLDAPQGIESLQFTLNFNSEKLGLVSISDGDLHGDLMYNTELAGQGLIPVSWFTTESQPHARASVLVLRFMVIAEQEIASVLGLSSDFIETECHHLEKGHLDIQLRSGNTSDLGEGDIVVYQNRPNPFSESTIIPFVLNEADVVQLRIYSNYGELLLEQKKKCNSGYNQFEVESIQIDRTGIFFYEINTKKLSITNRMIIARK